MTSEQGKKMSSTDHNTPTNKSGRRNKKGEPRRQKPDSKQNAAPAEMQSPEPDEKLHLEPDQVESDQAQSPTADQQSTVSEQIEAAVALPEAVPAAEPSPAEPAPVSLQTIANAYRDYTRKSFEEMGSYFEQLTGVRSLDKAMKVQTEFAKRAYDTSVAETQKICELHNRLAKQTLRPFQGFVGKTPETHGKS